MGRLEYDFRRTSGGTGGVMWSGVSKNPMDNVQTVIYINNTIISTENVG